MYYNNDLTLLYLDGKFVKANESKIDLYKSNYTMVCGVFLKVFAYATGGRNCQGLVKQRAL